MPGHRGSPSSSAFVLTTLALILFVAGVDGAGYSLTAVAIALAALDAATGLCLGCKVYLQLRRPRSA